MLAAAEPRVLIPPTIDPRLLAGRADGDAVALSGETMGTNWSVRATTRIAPAAVEAIVRATCDAVIAEMSGWDMSSELARFNRAAAGTWHALSAGFFDVLRTGIGYAEASGGAFDPGAGALVAAWGFGPDGYTGEPDAAAIEVARWRGDARRVVLDLHARRARQPGGLALDLSGIAKGHAVDRVAGALAAQGIAHMLVEIGGELIGLGVQRDGQPWWVDIEPPPGITLPVTRIALCGLAVATSGDYRRRRDDGARAASHSIDPRTGRPIDNGIASVTVLHASSMHADALATALTVLGPVTGFALAERDGIAAQMIERTPAGAIEHRSAAWDAMAA